MLDTTLQQDQTSIGGRFHGRLMTLPCFVYLLIALAAALVIELFVFNSSFFSFDADSHPRREISLPFNQALGKNAAVLDQEHTALSVSDLNLPAATVYIEAYQTYKRLVKARLSIADASHQNLLVPVTELKLVPGGEHNSALGRIWERGNLTALQISFSPEDLRGGLAVTRLIINEPPALNFSLLRTLVMTLGLGGLLLILRLKLYKLTFNPDNWRHRAANYAVLSAALGMSIFVFALNNPRVTEPFGFDYLGEGVMVVTDSRHELLKDLPQTPEEFANCDAHVQQLDAFLKGQLNFDFPTDPRLLQISNVYDQSIRGQIPDLYYLYDRCFYHGKYYSYFGLAPIITIYAPIYLLTGKVPSLALAAFIASIYAVLALFAAFNCLRRSFKLKPNLLTYLTAELGGIFALIIYSMQMWPNHYMMVCVTSIASLAAAAACACLLTVKGISLLKQRLLLTGLGLAVVMVVMSRPLNLVYALLFTGPLLFFYIRSQLDELKTAQHSGRTCLLKSLACAAVPLGIGAVFEMWYNYTRFDSIFEFGVNYMITGQDPHADSLAWSWPVFKNAVYFFIFEPLTYLKDFPFVQLSADNYTNLGNYRYVVHRISLFAMPIFWGICLYPLWCGSKNKLNLPPAEKRLWDMQRLSFGLVLLALPVMVYLCYCAAGVQYRYLSDHSTVTVLIAFVLVISSTQQAPSREGAPYYLLTMFLLVKTIVIGFLLPISDSDGKFAPLNPDAFAGLARLFDPLAF